MQDTTRKEILFVLLFIFITQPYRELYTILNNHCTQTDSTMNLSLWQK